MTCVAVDADKVGEKVSSVCIGPGPGESRVGQDGVQGR